MGKKFIFISGLFFFIPCLGMEIVQEKKSSLTDDDMKKLCRSYCKENGVGFFAILNQYEVEDWNEIVNSVKYELYKTQEKLKWVSIFRYAPYPKFHKRTINDSKDSED